MKHLFNRLSSAHIVLTVFLAVILAGSILLCLPVSSRDGTSVSYIDALFTATTATCVTGLVTLPTATAWSLFGQVVILVLIQVGGLGVITVMTGIMLMLSRKIGMDDRILIQDAFNLNSLSGIVMFVKKVIRGTFIVEGVGALFYMTVFVPEFGLRGIWISVFNSVSAFCNAGMDIIGENSLCAYDANPLINAVTAVLIILGGLGFVVWWDIIRVLKQKKKLKFLTLHSKIVICSTTIFILAGSVLFFIFEYTNPSTAGGLGIFDKIQMCLFQSVTTRTAGFITVPQENLTDASTLLSLLLMFIGGSPVGTAGGIKTVTFVVLFAAALSVIKNKSSVEMFSRRIPEAAVRKAIAVCSASFVTMFVSTMLLAHISSRDFLDVIYETVSATATVGLSRNFTASLNGFGKAVIIATMYFGRVGPISIALAFNIKKESKNIVTNPAEDIYIG